MNRYRCDYHSNVKASEWDLSTFALVTNRFLFILSRCHKILGERNVVGLKKSRRLVEEVSVPYVTTSMAYFSLDEVILRDSNILIRTRLVLEVGFMISDWMPVTILNAMQTLLSAKAISHLMPSCPRQARRIASYEGLNVGKDILTLSFTISNISGGTREI